MELAPKKMNLGISFLIVGISMFLIANADQYIIATCNIQSLNETNKTVSGFIEFYQLASGGNTTVVGNLTGFAWSGLHGFHVHQYGNLGSYCADAGLHYNPFNMTHGAPTDAVRHVGDLGNINVDNNMNSNIYIIDNVISLIGNYSIIGLSIVVHSDQDDLGRGNFSDSKTTGHAGSRIGCCIITLNPNATMPPTMSPPSSTTGGPAGSAASIRPLAIVFAFCLVAVQSVQKLLHGGFNG